MNLFARLLLLVMVMLSICVLWRLFVLTALENRQISLLSEIAGKQEDIALLQQRTEKLGEVRQPVSDDQAGLARLKSLRSKLVQVQAGIEATGDGLVSANAMAGLLEQVLQETGWVSLIRLRGLGMETLYDGSQTVNGDAESLYRYGFRIEFAGDFYTTLDYLRNLEALEQDFIWDSFEMNVIDYPTVNTVIDLSTLGTEPAAGV